MDRVPSTGINILTVWQNGEPSNPEWKRMYPKGMTNGKPNSDPNQFKTGSSRVAEVLHNVQPLSPSSGDLLKAL
jgi:hypothetical protein